VPRCRSAAARRASTAAGSVSKAVTSRTNPAEAPPSRDAPPWSPSSGVSSQR